MRSTVNTTVAGLLTVLLHGCVVMDTEDDRGASRSARAAELMLEREVVPKLLAALSPEERRRLQPVSATVIASTDPLRIALESERRKGSRLVVSTRFLALQDLLIDGSVISSATTGHERQLIDYSVQAARVALRGSRVIQTERPQPFWQSIGWTAARYQTFSIDPRFEALRQRATTQTLAWLAATLISERLYGDMIVGAADSDPQQNAARVRERAADLLLRARLGPVPAWSVAILLSAIRHPDANASNEWICGARDVLETALVVTGKRDRRAEDERDMKLRGTVMARWRDSSQVLQQHAMCEPEGSTEGAQPPS